MADLNALTIFAKIVEANSFSEAARRLKMPISTVSRRISDLEDQLGIRLLQRSTRSLRLTEIGFELLEHARRSADISDTVDGVVSNKLSVVSGLLRLSAPPNLCETLLTPLIMAFQAAYPEARVDVFATDRYVDQVAEGIDLVFRVGALRDSSLIARKILTYRHLLVTSAAYAQRDDLPEKPDDLFTHRLLCFRQTTVDANWTFVNVHSREQIDLAFKASLAMNDYAGLAAATLAGNGIGELPAIVRPDLLREGHLIEIMPDWHFPPVDLSLVYVGARHIPKVVRVFIDFAAQMAPRLFGELPY